ncbi:MAG: type II toxin-antitoxin system VapC family toxin [Myxococcaceae bacterium]
MHKVILDASALLALINSEPGADKVSKVLPDAQMSSVNYSEVATVLQNMGVSGDVIESILDGLVKVIPFSQQHALFAASLYPKTKSHGLSLGDRACLTLGHFSKCPVYTADRVWANLDLGIKVHLIR